MTDRSVAEIDAIWLSPILSIANGDFGYDVSDYCNIHPLLVILKFLTDWLLTRTTAISRSFLFFQPHI
jgi:hypothetical protein